MLPLAPGTQVGNWRVEALQGRGAYGAVYRCVLMGQEHAGPVALKLSLLPWNARMVREAELLSRLSHPGFPRLLDTGTEQHTPSSHERCRVLAELARALEALHASGAVHRDVKGDNVLVQLSDRLPVLVDLGSCHFQGAERLTRQSLAPHTPTYLSPQACLFHIRLARNRDSYYPPSPADDLYALGVTAYRLLMGQYPPDMQMRRGEDNAWQVSPPNLRPLLERNPQVAPGLREVILQLFSEAPEARGTAAQVAQTLEALANAPVAAQRPAKLEPVAKAPPLDVPAPAGGNERPPRVRPPARAWAWEPWLALAVVGVCALVLWTVPPAPWPPAHVSSCPPPSASQAPDAGTAAVGEALPTEPQPSPPPPAEKKPITQEPLPKPRPSRQAQPDKRGRCPGPKQVAINGGCWLPTSSMTAEECVENGGEIFKGRCYTPAREPPMKPQPTSNPSKAR